jgi:hypothetical protein
MRQSFFKILRLIVVTVFFWSFLGIFSAQAANFDIKTNSPSCQIGDNIIVNISLNSVDVAANAVQGTITFSPNSLSNIDLSTSNSVVQFWVHEPVKNNASGVISFEGAIMNPGYLGGSGKILTLTFNCRQEGTSLISFSSGSILANDGQGTSILDKLSSLNINVLPKTVVTTTILPKTSVPIDTGTITGTKASPKLILESLTKQATDPIVAFSFKVQGADDPDYYEVIIDNGTKEIWPTSKNTHYETRVLTPGNHSIGVTAIYKNDYSLIATQDFTIEPLVLPIIKNLPTKISTDDAFEIEIGTEYPFSNVKIESQPLKGGTPIITVLATDKDGSLTTSLKGMLSEGSYLIRAQVFLDSLASSNYTSPVVVLVEPSALKQIQTLAINYLRIIVILAAITIVLAASIFYVLERMRRYNRKYRKTLEQSFKSLEAEGENIIELSDGIKGFSLTEHKSLNKFKELLDKLKKSLNSTKL